MNLKAIAFDIDGTLYPNSKAYFKSIPYLLANLKLILSFDKTRKKLREEGEIIDYFSTQAKYLALEMKISEEEANSRINKLYIDHENIIKRVPIFRGVEPVLKSLKESGFKLVALSDFPTETKLDSLKIGGYWDLILSSERLGSLKPNPKAFNTIIEQTGLNPNEILYVGNSYKYDVMGSKKAGMYSAHISFFKKKNSIADFTFYDYKKLLNWIGENNTKE